MESSGWTEIFRIGKHIDSNGKARFWSKADLDRIVSSYNPEYHEAPVVIGHPVDNAPAWGWVKKLKREGNILVANLGDLLPEFKAWVSKGMYKKKSISLYPDMTLRHIAFLGAVPPAVKGLADFKFSEGQYLTICSKEGRAESKMQEEKLFKSFMEKIGNVFHKLTEDDIDVVPKAASHHNMSHEHGKQESATQLLRRLEEKEAELSKFKEDAKKAKVVAFCSKLKEQGKFLPSWEDDGIAEFMMGLDAGKNIEFAENKNGTLAEWFTDFLETLPGVVSLGESPSDDTPLPGDTESMIEQYMKLKDLDYKAAVLAISKKRPGIFIKQQ